MSREGWAWGITHGGEWLTIPGSAYRHPQLGATADGTPRPAWAAPDQLILARVREVYHPGVSLTGLAYRILEVHAPEQAKP